jgi:hypothetical protein
VGEKETPATNIGEYSLVRATFGVMSGAANANEPIHPTKTINTFKTIHTPYVITRLSVQCAQYIRNGKYLRSLLEFKYQIQGSFAHAIEIKGVATTLPSNL